MKQIDSVKTVSSHLLARSFISCLGGKWRLVVLTAIFQRTLRFNELQQTIPGITARMLSKELKVLENYGFIEKNVYREKPPRVEYQISDSGIQLFPLIEAICLYGEKFLENEHIQRVNDLKPKRKTTKSKSKSTEDLEIIEENGLKFVKVTHMIKSLPKTQKKQRAIISEHKDLIVAQDASEIEIEIAPAKQSNLEDKQDLIKTPKTKVEKKSSSKKTKSENQANSLLDQKPNEIIQLSLF